MHSRTPKNFPRHFVFNSLKLYSSSRLTDPTTPLDSTGDKVVVSYHLVLTGPGGRAVQGVSLRPLACWDGGLESCRGHEYLSLVSVVCYKVEVPMTGRSLVQRNPTKSVFIIEFDQVQQ